MSILSPQQIYDLAVNAGFPSDVAETMTGIAIRESGGNPLAFNGNHATGDESYGLWQINMIGSMGKQRMNQLGLSSPSELLDPSVNARAAFQLWNGNNANLDTLWYVNRGIWKERLDTILASIKGTLNLGSGDTGNVAVDEYGVPIEPVTGPSTDFYSVGLIALVVFGAFLLIRRVAN